MARILKTLESIPFSLSVYVITRLEFEFKAYSLVSLCYITYIVVHYVSDCVSGCQNSSQANLNVGYWYNFALVYDPHGLTITVYLDTQQSLSIMLAGALSTTSNSRYVAVYAMVLQN